MPFAFKEVERNSGGRGLALEAKSLRVTPKSIQLSKEVVAQANAAAYQRPSGQKIRVSIAVDPKSNAIKVKADKRGFVMNVTPAGAAWMPLSKTLKSLKAGDYMPVKGQRSVFQLA